MTAIQKFTAAQARLLRRYGVDARSCFVEIPAVCGRVHVLQCGSGPPVVMLPGFGDPAAMWAPLMAQLGGFNLQAIDRPNFGLTGSARQTTATIRRLAVDFLEQTLDTLELERPLIIANSIGSLWATWLALDRSERVSGMVHIGCPAFMLGTSAPLIMRLLSIRPIGRLLMRISPPSPRQVERFARMIGENLSGFPELRDLLVAAQRLPGAQNSVLDLLHATVRLRGARRQFVLEERHLAQIRQPVLLIWGARDAFGAPAVGRKAVRLMPDAELHVVAEGGHVPWIAHAAEVGAAAMPFLQRRGAGGIRSLA